MGKIMRAIRRVAAGGLGLPLSVFWLSAGPVAAGAWPRDPGAVFLSLSQQVSSGTPTLLAPDQSFRSYTAIYGEYGWSDRLTLGVDGAYGWGPEADLWTGLVFARWALGQSARGDRYSVDFGLGRRLDSEEGGDLRLRLGLAWGRGYESRWGPGWMGIEGSTERLLPSEDTVYKADFTLGLKPDDDWMLILQAQTGRYPGADTLVRLAPSVARRLSPRVQAQLGFDMTVMGERSYGVKFATWISF